YSCYPPVSFFLLTICPPPTPPPFPYPTRFRSRLYRLASRLLDARYPPRLRTRARWRRVPDRFGRALLRDPRRAFVRIFVRDQRRSEEHTSELQSRENLVCRLLLVKKNTSASHR